MWNGSHVDVGIDFDQEGYSNLVRLRSEIDFLTDSTKVKILPSLIRLLDREWVIDQKNYALTSNREWQIHNLNIHHDDQLISVDGKISPDPDQNLRIVFSNLNLDLINALSTEKFTGILNGEVNARDLYKNPYFQNDIAVKAFTVNDFLVGDITGTNKWNQSENRFDINFVIDRHGQKIVNVTGNYNPDEPNDPLNIKADLQNANLKIIEPFLKGMFSQIDGTVSGEYLITGNFTKPRIKGEGKIQDGQVMIDYLKVLYRVTGVIGMTNDQIIFRDFVSH